MRKHSLMTGRVVFCLIALVSEVSPAVAAPLDDKIELGGFHPNMTLEEADRLAGAPGKRECTTWPPKPIIHWCEWTFSNAEQYVELHYGPDGTIYDLERRVPLPEGMSEDEALRQAAEKLKRYGTPARDIMPDNLHWGCKDDDCSGPRMIRVWIMVLEDLFDGRRHMAIGWTNRVRAQRNQERFERESEAWSKAQQPDTSPLKL